MLNKNTHIRCSIENPKIPAGFLAYFSTVQLICMFTLFKLSLKYVVINLFMWDNFGTQR